MNRYLTLLTLKHLNGIEPLLKISKIFVLTIKLKMFLKYFKIFYFILFIIFFFLN